jgi:hypothetical protein
MSTKTLRKRIALVAVTALGAGLLSVVAIPSANATAGDLTFTGTGLLGSVTTNNATTQTATILTTGSLVITTTGGAAGYYVVSAGATITAESGTGTISADQKKFDPSAADDTFTVVPTGAAGSTFTIAGYTTPTSGVVTDLLTVSIAATSEYGVASASESTVSWVATATAEATSDVANENATDYATNALYLNVQLNDAYGNNITSTTGALVATVTAGATVGFGPITTCGTVVDPTATAGTYTQSVTATCPQSINLIVKQATVGAGWNGTVTVTYNGVAIATKSGKITGAPASLLVSPEYINRPNSTANVTWVYYVKDSAGNELDAAAVDIALSTSSDNSVISAAAGATATDPTDANDDSKTYGAGTSTCDKAGSSKVVMQITTNGNVVKSNEMTILCAGAAASYTAALDKASYVQGEIATLTVTFKDAAGNLANSLQVVDTFTNASGATAGVTDAVISAPMMKTVASSTSLHVADGIFVGKAGTLTYKFTVGTDLGITEGAYNMVVSFPTVDDATTVAYKVGTGSTSVSNADVLKSIVSLIASINKQIRALQKALLRR